MKNSRQYTVVSKHFMVKAFMTMRPLWFATCCLLLTAYSLLSSVSSAQDTLQESLSELNRILPAKKIATIPWGRDPFVPLIGDEFLSSVKLRLTAIIYNEKRPSAILNDKIVYIGDRVDGQKVIDITKQYVILRGSGGSYKLEISSTGRRSYDIKKNP